MSNILVLAVHPDDETLGCGGTLLRHKAKGDKIYWLIATNISRDQGFSEQAVKDRDEEVKRVKDIFGFDAVFELAIPTKKTDVMPRADIVEKISDVFNKVRPEILYLPYNQDVHSDHKVIFEAAFSSTKVFRSPFIRRILMAETISETEFAPSFKESVFTPNYFVDISDFLDKKLEIMKVFKSEIGEHPFSRSLENIKALATFRGSIAGCKYAESFMLLKEIS